MKNLELLNQLLDQKSNDLDEEKQNFYEKYDSKTMTEHDLMIYSSGIAQILNRESRTSEGQQIIRELRSEVVQMKAPAVPLALTINLEVKIESRSSKCEGGGDVVGVVTSLVGGVAQA